MDADAAGQLEGFVGADDVNALVGDADLVRFVNAVSGLHKETVGELG